MDKPAKRKKLLLIVRHSPYGSGLARASLDLALAAAAFDQDLNLLFMDDGVWQLLPGQNTTELGYKSVQKTLASMPLYDIDRFYVEASSLCSRQLLVEQLSGQIELIETAAIGQFIASHDQIVSF